MKADELFYALAEVDENLTATQEKRKNGKRAARIAVPCALVFVAAVTAAALMNLPDTKTPPVTEGAPSSSGEIYEIGTADPHDPEITSTGSTETQSPGIDEIASGQAVDVPDTPDGDEKTSDKTDGAGVYGGDDIQTAGFCVPCVPFDKTVVTAGQPITDADAKAYFNENKEHVISALAASGVDVSDCYFSEKGYCHASYTGAEGEKITVNEAQRDYILFGKNGIAAIVTLFRYENGEIGSSPAFGAWWFSSYYDFLKAHQGQELVYVYSGWAELVLTPSGEIYNTGLSPDYDRFQYTMGLCEIDAPYEIFRHPSDIFVP